MLAADYPFLDLMWTMFIFFIWILWFWLLFTVFADIFRRHDISGWGKAAWLLFTILLPFLGVFVYLITQNTGMTERNLERARAQKAQFDDYVRQTAGESGGGATAEIERAKSLLDSGAINQSEFDAIKQKALA
jgi:Phospholipase_D-nuclease N-terminal/Short C-terminal domain